MIVDHLFFLNTLITNYLTKQTQSGLEQMEKYQSDFFGREF